MGLVDRSEDRLRVIALVGSAGGLVAVSWVLGGLPADLGAAVIVLIHQGPDRESNLVRILGKATRLPVAAAQDGIPLRAGTVVVAPPGKHVLITAGPTVRLIASGASPPSRPSADLLLSTLATACGPQATAVVLSGSGHDGATGATAVHHLGGTVLASSELTSEYFSMPRAAIERGEAVDKIVSLGDMAALLVSETAHLGASHEPEPQQGEMVRVPGEEEPGAGEPVLVRWQRREASANRREHLADERDRIADERDRVADERDRAADERERLADEREGTAEQREVERRARADAARTRHWEAQQREQAQINRETADTARGIARDEDAAQEHAVQEGQAQSP